MNSQTNTMKQDNDTKTTDSLAVDSASAGSLPADGYWWLYDEERYRWEVVKVKGATFYRIGVMSSNEVSYFEGKWGSKVENVEGIYR